MVHVTYPTAYPSHMKKLCPCLGGSLAALLTTCSTVPMLMVKIVCLHDVAWFYDLASVGSLLWLLMYCGSYICNDISCLVGFLFCTSYIIVIFLCFYSLEDITRRKLKADASWRKEDITLLFLSTLCLLLSHLPHSNEDPNDQERRILKILHPDNKRGRLPTYLNSNILIYLPSPCFFFLRISGRDSV
jgi:hypothetical protein